MTCRVGANIHGFSVERARVEWFVQLVKPRVVTVVSNAALARDVLAWSGGETLVIFRHWWACSSSGDDGLWTKVAAEEYLAEAMEQAQDKRLVLHLDNEPLFPLPLGSPERRAALGRWSDWALAGMAFAEARGWRCCVGNFAPANIAASDWNSGLLPVLNELSRGYHLLGTHDYRIAGHQEYPYLGQHQGADQVADERGFARPRKVVTELACANPEWQAQGFSEEAYADWLAAMDTAIYAKDGVLGECVFCLGNSGQWAKFDMATKTVFWEQVAAYGRRAPAGAVVLSAEPGPGPRGKSENGDEMGARLMTVEDALHNLQELLAGLDSCVQTLEERVVALEKRIFSRFPCRWRGRE